MLLSLSFYNHIVLGISPISKGSGLSNGVYHITGGNDYA